jgi:hypothetical protein
MKRLLETYIREVLSEKKIMLKEKPCECAEGEKCECAEGEGKSCGCSEGESCNECGPSEVDEASFAAAVSGPMVPVGAGPRGKVRYADPRTKDSPIEGPSKHLRKSNKKRKTKK